jgi:hypothetical protein
MNTKIVNVFYNKSNTKLKVGRLALNDRKIFLLTSALSPKNIKIPLLNPMVKRF